MNEERLRKALEGIGQAILCPAYSGTPQTLLDEIQQIVDDALAATSDPTEMEKLEKRLMEHYVTEDTAAFRAQEETHRRYHQGRRTAFAEVHGWIIRPRLPEHITQMGEKHAE